MISKHPKSNGYNPHILYWTVNHLHTALHLNPTIHYHLLAQALLIKPLISDSDSLNNEDISYPYGVQAWFRIPYGQPHVMFQVN